MRHSITAALLAGALVLAGGAAVRADTLQLAGGESLDLGPRVGVLDGQRTFLGAQLRDWMWKPEAQQDLEKALATTNVVKDETQRKEVSALALDILKHGKVYQVRSVANDTYYQGMVVSLSVSDGDLLKLALLGNVGPALPEAQQQDTKGKSRILLPEEEPGVKAAPADGQAGKADTKKADKKAAASAEEPENDGQPDLAPLLHGLVQVTDHSGWEDKTSKDGVAYRTGSARVTFTKNGFAIPLYVRGVVTKEEGRSTYTAFIADQVSGTFFDPVINKALQGAKK